LKENEGLRREKDQDTTTDESLYAEVAKLSKKLERLQKEREQDKTVIAYLESERRRSVSPAIHEVRADHDRRTPRDTSETLKRLHVNPKFPDAPVFFGDRAKFESWKDKVRDSWHKECGPRFSPPSLNDRPDPASVRVFKYSRDLNLVS
jgi:hypothetical protein